MVVFLAIDCDWRESNWWCMSRCMPIYGVDELTQLVYIPLSYHFNKVVIVCTWLGSIPPMHFQKFKSWTLVKHPTYLRTKLLCVSIGGSVVECSPATRAARVRFPADATILWCCNVFRDRSVAKFLIIVRDNLPQTVDYSYLLPSKAIRSEKCYLPDGESNPGLPRDRRGYLPLYYRG